MPGLLPGKTAKNDEQDVDRRSNDSATTRSTATEASSDRTEDGVNITAQADHFGIQHKAPGGARPRFHGGLASGRPEGVATVARTRSRV
jgi:hypothetical protein